MSEALTCTCNTAKTDRWNHQNWCDLWLDDDFFRGDAEWDPLLNRLITIKEVLVVDPDGETTAHAVEEEEDGGEATDLYDPLDYPEELLEENRKANCPEPGLLDIQTGVPINAMKLVESLRIWIDQECREMWDGKYLSQGGLVACWCVLGNIENNRLKCGGCGVERLSHKSPWRRNSTRWDDEEFVHPDKIKCYCASPRALCGICGAQVVRPEQYPKMGLTEQKSTWWEVQDTSKSGYTGYSSPKCNHDQQEVVMPSGRKYFCSQSSRTGGSDKTRPLPDIHVMLASGQRPQIVAYYIDWPDHGLPNLSIAQFTDFLKHLVKQSKAGKMIEMGCIGAHGRTGTMLACLYIWEHTAEGLKDVKAEEIIDWVQDKYCNEAIEGSKQEWFVDAILHVRRGQEIPEYVPPPPKSYSSTPSTPHASTSSAPKSTTPSTNGQGTLPISTPKVQLPRIHLHRGFQGKDDLVVIDAWDGNIKILDLEYVVTPPFPADARDWDPDACVLLLPRKDAKDGAYKEGATAPSSADSKEKT